MSTLAEIEQAADNLPADQKQELMLFLGARLRAGGATLPEPRKFSRERIQSWIAEDEAALRQLQPETNANSRADSIHRTGTMQLRRSVNNGEAPSIETD